MYEIISILKNRISNIIQKGNTKHVLFGATMTIKTIENSLQAKQLF